MMGMGVTMQLLLCISVGLQGLFFLIFVLGGGGAGGDVNTHAYDFETISHVRPAWPGPSSVDLLTQPEHHDC